MHAVRAYSYTLDYRNTDYHIDPYFSSPYGSDSNCLVWDHVDKWNCVMCKDQYYIATNSRYNSTHDKYYDGCEPCMTKHQLFIIDIL